MDVRINFISILKRKNLLRLKVFHTMKKNAVKE